MLFVASIAFVSFSVSSASCLKHMTGECTDYHNFLYVGCTCNNMRRQCKAAWDNSNFRKTRSAWRTRIREFMKQHVWADVLREKEREREKEKEMEVIGEQWSRIIEKKKIADREKEWIFVYLFYGPYHVIWFCRVPQRASFLQAYFLPFSRIAPGRTPNFYNSLFPTGYHYTFTPSRLSRFLGWTDGGERLAVHCGKQRINGRPNGIWKRVETNLFRSYVCPKSWKPLKDARWKCQEIKDTGV